MFKRIAPVAVLVALVAPASSHAADAKTTVTIGGYVDVPANDYFIGEVKSPRGSCEVGRKVTLYRRKSGRDPKLGSDKSFEGKGDSVAWLITYDDAAPGKYYVKVKKTSKCKGDKSKNFVVPG